MNISTIPPLHAGAAGASAGVAVAAAMAPSAAPAGSAPSPAPAPAPAPAEPRLPRASLVIWLTAGAAAALFAWAARFQLEEVSTGIGKVVASSKEQVVQSLEGGVLAELRVKEGDIVNPGQVLAQLDRTRVESGVEESASRVRAALATSARLSAEVNQTALSFPPEVREEPDLVRAETGLYHSRRRALSEALSGLVEAQRLVRNELELTEPLVLKGAASAVEVLRLKRQLNELQNKASDTRTQYLVRAREELAKANAEIESQQSVTRGRADSLTRLTLNSPVRGIVKDITVSTLGGVIPPNGKLMEIVPLDDKLQIETRISPRDIAYIHPGQAATVKVTAYDYAIYGGMPGEVVMISPDTIQDDVRRDVYYYRVYIRTARDSLTSPGGKPLPIVPGMVTTVDIHTGGKSVLSYLTKPLNKAGEAMRER